MRLNYDCIRDVLLELEEMLTCNYTDQNFHTNEVDIENLFDKLSDKNYTIEEIFYSVKNLEQAKFIIADFKQADDGIIDCEIFDITYEGHEFINKVRKDKVWNKVKDKVMSTGASVTLSVISKLTTDTILGFISNVTSP